MRQKTDAEVGSVTSRSATDKESDKDADKEGKAVRCNGLNSNSRVLVFCAFFLNWADSCIKFKLFIKFFIPYIRLSVEIY